MLTKGLHTFRTKYTMSHSTTLTYRQSLHGLNTYKQGRVEGGREGGINWCHRTLWCDTSPVARPIDLLAVCRQHKPTR